MSELSFYHNEPTEIPRGAFRLLKKSGGGLSFHPLSHDLVKCGFRSDTEHIVRAPLVARDRGDLVVSGCVFAAWGGTYHGSGKEREVLYAVEVRLGKTMLVRSSPVAWTKGV